MKPLVHCDDMAEACRVRDRLEESGIPAILVDDRSSPSTAGWSVCLQSDGDLDRALGVLDSVAPRAAEDPESAEAAEGVESVETGATEEDFEKVYFPERRARASTARALFCTGGGFELLAVSYLGWFQHLLAEILNWLLDAGPWPEAPFVEEYAFRIVWSMAVILPVLALMIVRTKGKVETFGLVKIRPFSDVMTGVMVFLIGAVVHSAGAQVLSTVLGPDVYDLESIGARSTPEGFEYAFGALAIVVLALEEELVFRAYLITRLRDLLGSVWKSVAISAAMFASVHIYQGFEGVVSAAVGGLLWGAVFGLTRRIWPLVVAHSVWNLAAYGGTG